MESFVYTSPLNPNYPLVGKFSADQPKQSYNLFKNKIYNNFDVFNYMVSFLNFSDKISFSKSININLIKNYNLIDNKFNKKTLFDIDCICSDCYCELTSDQSLLLSSKYDNFLYYDLSDSDSDLSNDSSNVSYNYYDSSYSNIYRCAQMHEETEFICSTYFYVATRAFIEIMDLKNITINLDKIKCIFELEVEQNTYNLIHNKIDEIYYEGIENYDLDILCKKCGVFGHSDETKVCPLFNKSYENHIIKKVTREITTSLINKIIQNDIDEKKTIERQKKLCKNCNKHFFSSTCIYKLCKTCCQYNKENNSCNNHYLKKNNKKNK
jgi:hypothetical protein